MVCTKANANFENLRSLGTIKPREIQNVRFQFITLSGLCLESLPIQTKKI